MLNTGLTSIITNTTIAYVFKAFLLFNFNDYAYFTITAYYFDCESFIVTLTVTLEPETDISEESNEFKPKFKEDPDDEFNAQADNSDQIFNEQTLELFWKKFRKFALKIIQQRGTVLKI